MYLPHATVESNPLEVTEIHLRGLTSPKKCFSQEMTPKQFLLRMRERAPWESHNVYNRDRLVVMHHIILKEHGFDSW
jgi:hypothetical protein